MTNFEWRACGRVGGGVGGHCLALPSPKWFETEGGRTAGGHGMQEKAPFTLCEKRSECTSIFEKDGSNNSNNECFMIDAKRDACPAAIVASS